MEKIIKNVLGGGLVIAATIMVAAMIYISLVYASDNSNEIVNEQESTTSQTENEQETQNKPSTQTKKVGSIVLESKCLTYNGKSRVPKVVVKDKNGKLISKKNYTVKCINNKDIGKAVAVIAMKGEYKGTYKRGFKIAPKGTKIKEVWTDYDRIRLTYTKKANSVDGYVIQISTNKKFSKNVKTKRIKNKQKNEFIFKGLDKNTVYYARVRTYKKVNDKNYYSKWNTFEKKIKTDKKPKTYAQKIEISKSVQEIIDMSEAEIWQLITEGRYSSYSEVNTACHNNYEGMRQFFASRLKTIAVPCWKWADASKTRKVSSTCYITVNKYVSDYFKSFMTDLYNCPEKYVIENIGGYCYRAKNNGTGTTAMSAHSFGVVLDINAGCAGMGTVVWGTGTPFRTDVGLSDPAKSAACCFSGNWYQLAKRYRLDWGGLWSSNYLDPMHFSIVGDRNRDTLSYNPRVRGMNPY